MNRRSRHALSPNGCLRRIARSVESKSTAAPFPEIGNMQSRSFLSIGAGLLLLASCGGKKFQPEGGPFVQPPPMHDACDLGVPDGAIVGAARPARRSDGHERLERGRAGRRVHVRSVRPVLFVLRRLSRRRRAWQPPHRQERRRVRGRLRRDLAGAGHASDDPTKRMPRPGKPWSERAPGDPIYDFVSYAQGLAVGRQTQRRVRRRQRHGRRVDVAEGELHVHDHRRRRR